MPLSYFCHACQNETQQPIMSPHPICPRCRSDFIEEIEQQEERPSQTNAGFAAFDGPHEHYGTRQGRFSSPESSSEIPPAAQMMMNLFESIMRNTQPSSATSTSSSSTGGTNASTNQSSNNNRQNHPFFQFAFQSGSAPPFNLEELLFPSGQSNDETPMSFIMNLFRLAGNASDYAFGDEDFDDIITRLMEQTATKSGPPPASDEIIKSLPRVSYFSVQGNNECNICQEEFNNDTIVTRLPCSHLFHDPCITPWLKVNGTCPTCRMSVTPEKEN